LAEERAETDRIIAELRRQKRLAAAEGRELTRQNKALEERAKAAEARVSELEAALVKRASEDDGVPSSSGANFRASDGGCPGGDDRDMGRSSPIPDRVQAENSAALAETMVLAIKSPRQLNPFVGNVSNRENFPDFPSAFSDSTAALEPTWAAASLHGVGSRHSPSVNGCTSSESAHAPPATMLASATADGDGPCDSCPKLERPSPSGSDAPASKAGDEEDEEAEEFELSIVT
jgi:hypothetical protein